MATTEMSAWFASCEVDRLLFFVVFPSRYVLCNTDDIPARQLPFPLSLSFIIDCLRGSYANDRDVLALQDDRKLIGSHDGRVHGT